MAAKLTIDVRALAPPERHLRIDLRGRRFRRHRPGVGACRALSLVVGLFGAARVSCCKHVDGNHLATLLQPVAR